MRLGTKLTRFEWEFARKYGELQRVGKYVTQAGVQVKDACAYTSEHLDVSVTNLKPVNHWNLHCSDRWSGRDGFRHFVWFV